MLQRQLARSLRWLENIRRGSAVSNAPRVAETFQIPSHKIMLMSVNPVKLAEPLRMMFSNLRLRPLSTAGDCMQ